MVPWIRENRLILSVKGAVWYAYGIVRMADNMADIAGETMADTRTITLSEFLLARIAEDVARATIARGWQTGSRHEGQPLDWSIHMDRWSPDRVLAECEAKRRIVTRHSDCGTGYGHCDDGGHGWGVDPLGCADLADLASVFADHPDYDEKWRA